MQIDSKRELNIHLNKLKLTDDNEFILEQQAPLM